jgi:hypothetical protein
MAEAEDPDPEHAAHSLKVGDAGLQAVAAADLPPRRRVTPIKRKLDNRLHLIGDIDGISPVWRRS